MEQIASIKNYDFLFFFFAFDFCISMNCEYAESDFSFFIFCSSQTRHHIEYLISLLRRRCDPIQCETRFRCTDLLVPFPISLCHLELAMVGLASVFMQIKRRKKSHESCKRCGQRVSCCNILLSDKRETQ